MAVEHQQLWPSTKSPRLLLLAVSFCCVTLLVLWTKHPTGKLLYQPSMLNAAQCHEINLHVTRDTNSGDSDHQIPSLTSSELPLCSLNLIQNHSIKTGFFPTGGKWTIGNSSKDTWFSPDFCIFQYNVLPTDYLRQCLDRTRMSSVLVMGDSNAVHHFSALVDVIETSGFHCSVVKEETVKFHSNPAYYSAGTNVNKAFIKTVKHECKSCMAKFLSCVDNSTAVTRTLTLEFLMAEFYIDGEISTKHCFKSDIAAKKCVESKTTQLFYFQEYLKGRYPDIICIFGNSHSVRKKSLEQITQNVKTLVNIIDKHLPISSSLVWLPEVGEYEQKRPKRWWNHTFGKDHDSAQSMIHKINRAVFEAIKPSLSTPDRPSSHFAYFDTQNMSNDVLPFWSLDGIHMTPIWYHQFITYLLQSICSNKQGCTQQSVP